MTRVAGVPLSASDATDGEHFQVGASIGDRTDTAVFTGLASTPERDRRYDFAEAGMAPADADAASMSSFFDQAARGRAWKRVLASLASWKHLQA